MGPPFLKKKEKKMIQSIKPVSVLEWTCEMKQYTYHLPISEKIVSKSEVEVDKKKKKVECYLDE